MDFYTILLKPTPKGKFLIDIEFKLSKSKDLMIKGGQFYAFWDAENEFWCQATYRLAEIIDKDIEAFIKEHMGKELCADNYIVKWARNDSSKIIYSFLTKYCRSMTDSFHQLDTEILFANSKRKRESYATTTLPYSIQAGPYINYDSLISVLYNEEERKKIEWAIGSIVSGESTKIQKFLVFFGEGGTGKSTVLNIIQKLFAPYTKAFNAREIVSGNNRFSSAIFTSGCLVAIQQDGDLSSVMDSTLMNSIVSHEKMVVEEKGKQPYEIIPKAFLFLASNKEVKIDSKYSGLIRRLIDVSPTGNKVPPKDYTRYFEGIDFELGAIAYHCLQVYKELGKNYYDTYEPTRMLWDSNPIYNFMMENEDVFEMEDAITLKQLFKMYSEYCEECNIRMNLSRIKFRQQVRPYFSDYKERYRTEGLNLRNVFFGYKGKTINTEVIEDDTEPKLELTETTSLLDEMLKDCKAQYASTEETPCYKWDGVKTTLKEVDTRILHYLKPPENHIVIDFDLKDEKGVKSRDKNLTEASKWPETYAEFSKSGAGVHLHYIYDGDVSRLSRLYSEGIEIKTFTGNSSLRRQLSFCNRIPVATLVSGLPLREEKKNKMTIENEKQIRALIAGNLEKKYHPNTKPSVDFIYNILEEAFKTGFSYDVEDLKEAVQKFAGGSTNNVVYCLSLVRRMKWKSMDKRINLCIFDCEVFPNLFLVNWKFEGDEHIYRWINPRPDQIESLLKHKLVGYNCRRYDNHILYARTLGYTNEQLYELSQKIIKAKGTADCFFREAYNLHYLDVYEMSSEKKSLKAWEIDLGIHHLELGLPWDQPVDKSLWDKVSLYCDNDVKATEKVFHHLKGDYKARLILCKLSGLQPCNTTQQHAAAIIFGDDKTPQKEFIYTDLSKEFPGYEFKDGVSTYKGEEVGEGGYVFAVPGIYENAFLLDIASMHPTTARVLKIFGERYTKRFGDIVDGRLAVKHRDMEALSDLLDGAIKEIIDEDENIDFDDLAHSLKIIINIVYGMTSAKFINPFKDPRNVDNIVAKRGALFMVDLKEYLTGLGYQVVHIKTDSVKIANGDENVAKLVMEFGKKYGYNFELEAVYERMCLINDAVYIAKYDDKGIRNKGGKHAGEWTATGARFQHPYVFKSLFSKETIDFDDLCETKSVKSAIYIANREKDTKRFIGKVGSFVPVKPECVGAGELVRLDEKSGNYYYVTGTSGYLWQEAEYVRKRYGDLSMIDFSYYKALADEAIDKISAFGDFEKFVGDDDPLEGKINAPEYTVET